MKNMMNRLNLTRKKIIFICLFLAIFTIGTILIFITPTGVKSTYGLTVRTTDGVTIAFNVFEPKREGMNKKAIILGHGVMSNKEMLKGFAIELATAGFIAIPFDFRGHGQSTGELDRGSLKNDIYAIIYYLNSRPDVDSTALGYFGFSMGGFPGIQIVNESTNFKCFIGGGTRLPKNVRKGNSTAPLNILMILGRYDELITPEDLKVGLSDYTGIPSADLDVNKLYGSFQDGNAAMIYLDDNSNHVLGDWDPDFIRETRNFVMNTFPDVKPIDENFYANTRLLILFLQLIGGIGFFVLLIEPLSKLILPQNEEEILKIEVKEETIRSICIKTFGFSLLFAIPGIIIFLPIIIAGYLPTAGFILALLFGQAFGILLLIWRVGKKSNASLGNNIIKPFRIHRALLLRQFILGVILALIFALIIYASGGLNYIGMIPSLLKVAWVPLYFFLTFIIFTIFGILFQGTLQHKYTKGIKSQIKVALIIFSMMFFYMFFYLFVVAMIMGSFFYFGSFLPFAIPLFLLNSFITTISYQKTGNIIVGTIINTLFFTLLICTISPYQSGLSFLLGFIH